MESLHPCTFFHFARLTIHVENNPLVCNCSFNYLLQDRKSLAYTGQECRGGYAYQPHTQLSQPAVRKTKKILGKKLPDTSNACRNVFKHYNNLCSKLDCTNLCSPNERLVIQITTIAVPNRARSTLRQTFVLRLISIVFVILNRERVFQFAC